VGRVNTVNVAQAVGFASRSSHGMAVNQALGLVIAALAVPASVALVGFARAGNPWWIGPAVFDAFVVLMLVVDNLWPVQWRDPAQPAILMVAPTPRGPAHHQATGPAPRGTTGR